jgi:hypothetical protein
MRARSPPRIPRLAALEERYHVGLLVGFEIDGSTLTASFLRSEKGFWPFNEDQRGKVEALVAAVNAAHTA